jgi:hypothetical protein
MLFAVRSRSRVDRSISRASIPEGVEVSVTPPRRALL